MSRGRDILAPHDPDRGFTLLEVTVVVFIVGVLVTLAVLSVSGRVRSDQVELEARRIGELIRLAGERAIIYG